MAQITIILLVVTLIIWLVYDYFALTNETKGDTISAILQIYSHKWITLPFAFGYMMGHWFFPMESDRGFKYTIGYIIGLLCILGVMDHFRLHPGKEHTPYIVLLGIVLGHFLWPNNGLEGR